MEELQKEEICLKALKALYGEIRVMQQVRTKLLEETKDQYARLVAETQIECLDAILSFAPPDELIVPNVPTQPAPFPAALAALLGHRAPAPNQKPSPQPFSYHKAQPADVSPNNQKEDKK